MISRTLFSCIISQWTRYYYNNTTTQPYTNVVPKIIDFYRLVVSTVGQVLQNDHKKNHEYICVCVCVRVCMTSGNTITVSACRSYINTTKIFVVFKLRCLTKKSDLTLCWENTLVGVARVHAIVKLDNHKFMTTVQYNVSWRRVRLWLYTNFNFFNGVFPANSYIVKILYFQRNSIRHRIDLFLSLLYI